jgi:hypothetical protein
MIYSTGHVIARGFLQQKSSAGKHTDVKNSTPQTEPTRFSSEHCEIAHYWRRIGDLVMDNYLGYSMKTSLSGIFDSEKTILTQGSTSRATRTPPEISPHHCSVVVVLFAAPPSGSLDDADLAALPRPPTSPSPSGAALPPQTSSLPSL